MTELTFAHPEWNWLLAVPVAWILVFAGYRVWARRAARRLGGQLPDTRRRQWIRTGLVLAAGWAVAAALLGPRLPDTVATPPVAVADVVFVVDVSVSMLATDVPPSRLARMRQVLAQTLAALDHSRVGVVVYAAQALPFMPLTDDLPVAAAAVTALQPGLVARQGTRLGAAMQTAGYYFTDSARRNRVVFLLTDGENHDAGFASSVRQLARRHLAIVHTVGIGTEAGGNIPLPGNQGRAILKTDASGQPVLTRLEAGNLRRAAAEGGGQYFHAAATAETVRFITRRVEEARLAVGTPPRVTGYHHLFPWLLGLAVILLVLERLVGV